MQLHSWRRCWATAGDFGKTSRGWWANLATPFSSFTASGRSAEACLGCFAACVDSPASKCSQSCCAVNSTASLRSLDFAWPLWYWTELSGRDSAQMAWPAFVAAHWHWSCFLDLYLTFWTPLWLSCRCLAVEASLGCSRRFVISSAVPPSSALLRCCVDRGSGAATQGFLQFYSLRCTGCYSR